MRPMLNFIIILIILSISCDNPNLKNSKNLNSIENNEIEIKSNQIDTNSKNIKVGNEQVFQVIQINKKKYEDYFESIKSGNEITSISYDNTESISKIAYLEIKKYFQNNYKKDDVELYNFISMIPDLDSSYLFYRNNDYEGGVYKLLHKNANELIELFGEPIISPDRTYFATFKSHLYEGESQGIQIWEIIDHKHLDYLPENRKYFLKILEINECFFSPEFIFWNEENNLVVKGYRYSNEGKNQPVYFEIQFCKICQRFF